MKPIEETHPSFNNAIFKGMNLNAEGIFTKGVCNAIQEHTIDKKKILEAEEEILKTLYEEEWQDRRCLFTELNDKLGIK